MYVITRKLQMDLHRRCIAEKEENMYRILVCDDEKDIVRRGRNAKSATMPKNADVTDYRLATGLEALLGYLFLNGNTKRISELFSYVLEKYEKEENKP